jgi:Flp pilus assembly protein TadG
MHTTTPALSRRAASERGAILIQVGIAILVVSAFAMFVVDYGVAWVSRSQAQAAADAGALAGATALVRDDFDDRTATGPAKLAARAFAQAHVVFGQTPSVQMAEDIRFYNDAPSMFPAICATDDCIRVDVYRNQTRGNPLPVFFGWLVGLTEQGVRASAIARAATANASNCLKPWALADKWAENNPIPNSEWTPADTYDPTGATPDEYTAQNGTSSAGTSFTLNDVGTELTLKVGKPGDTRVAATAPTATKRTSWAARRGRSEWGTSTSTRKRGRWLGKPGRAPRRSSRSTPTPCGTG